jgi:penicillin amidase
MKAKLSDRFKTFTLQGSRIEMRRGAGGVVHMRGKDDIDFAQGLGFAHAHDRMLQMVLVRIVAEGRLCELVSDTDATFEIDVAMRQLGFVADTKLDQANLTPGAREFTGAYCAGFNAYLARYGYPWEFRLFGYRPEPWTVEHCLLTGKIVSYIGLAQTQEDIEKFVIQALSRGVALDRLRSLFAPHLDGLTQETAELLRKVNICNPLLPPSCFPSVLPGLRASNNWVLAPERTRTGFAIQCNDPHLECNRLPATWYEFVMETEGGYRMGVSIPGLPGLLMGRTEHLSMGFTYGFMDMVDFFIEECRDGKYRRENGYEAFTERIESIGRKKNRVELTVFENELGVLEIEPFGSGKTRDIPDGYYLVRAWSGHRHGVAKSINSLVDVLRARTVEEAQDTLRHITISANWLIADRKGNIAYQQSGLLPRRPHSGLYPLPAWESANRWRGLVSPKELASDRNPDEGFFVTANQDLNQPNKPLSINMPMGSYRAERIADLLEAKKVHGIDDMKRLQADLHSVQAEQFMELLEGAIPDTAAGRMLLDWNLRYESDSEGAYLFELVYHELLRELFGKGLFGLEAWDELVATSGILAVYYHVFDRIILEAPAIWFAEEPREQFLKRTVQQALEKAEDTLGRSWGEAQSVWMNQVFFDGKLPRFLGFDYGPISLEGSRATVVQGARFHSHGRETTFSPSYRYIADLGTEEVHTALAGGPSDRRFSRWFKNEISDWLAHRYKVLAVDPGRR